MKIIINNENLELVKKIKEKLENNNGYCPCALEKTKDTRCMCKEFRDFIGDPNSEGLCHCGLYKKVKE